MRIWHLLLCLLSLFLVSPAAQQLPSSQSSANDTSAGGSEPKTFVGCVTAMNGAFRLVTGSGAVLRLKGHHSELFSYNGKQVRITGSLAPSDSAPRTLVISKIKKLYDTC
jgi:hypothetical protein